METGCPMITRQTGELCASCTCHLVLCLKSILTEKFRINNNSLLDGFVIDSIYGFVHKILYRHHKIVYN